MILKSIKIFFFLSVNLYFVNLFSLENKIIVKVNNKIITYEMKNKILTTLFLSNEEINQNINKTKTLVLNSLIDIKLKENEIENIKLKF